MAAEQHDFLMVSEVARRLRVAAKTVNELVKRGDLRVAGTTSAGYRLYLAEDVEELAEKRRKNPPRRGPPPGTGGRPKKKATKVTKKTTTKKRSAKG